MNIIAPVNNVFEVERIIKAGANELYCGVMPKELWEKYNIMSCLNRRPSVTSNLSNYNELAKVVKLAHNHGISVSFTLNEFYPETQYNLVVEEFKRALSCEVDAFVVSDIGLLYMIQKRHLKKCSFKIHISNCGNVFNSKTAEFYSELGAERIILPRDLTIKEIKDLTRLLSVPMEMEAFILNQKCHNIDGFCTFQHGISTVKHKNIFCSKVLHNILGLFPSKALKMARSYFMKNELACLLGYNLNIVGESNNLKIAEIRESHKQYSSMKKFLYSCGACSIYELNNAGVNYIKIVGRCLFGDKIKDISFIRNCINLLKAVETRKEYIQEIRKLRKRMFGPGMCTKEYCYYLDNDIY